MATKAEELKALEEIRKIVDGIGGDNSYIGMAFEGCFELAEDNIKNDFGRSARQMAESARKEADTLTKKLEDSKKANEDLQKVIQDQADNLRIKREDNDQLTKNAEYLIEELTKANKAIEEKDGKIKIQDFEILTLKARLYDFMAQ